jgi:hypothetical protein
LELGAAGWPDVVEINSGTIELGGVGGEKKGLMVGGRVPTIEKRKGATGKMHKLAEKAPFRECTKGSRADWAEWRGGVQQVRRAGIGSTGSAGPAPDQIQI